MAQTRIEYHRLSDYRVDQNRSGSRLMIHIEHRVVVGMSVICNGPLHPRREVVLEGFAPAPDRPLVRRILLSVHTNDWVLRGHARAFVSSLSPERMHLSTTRRS